MRARDAVELLVLAALWGASFLFMRIAAPLFGPVPLIALRVAIAALFLAVLLGWRGAWAGARGKWFALAFVGLVNSALPFSLFAYATLHVTAGFAAVLNATAPLFAALVAFVWSGERLAPSRVLGLIIGFSGVIVLVWGRISFHGHGSGWAVVAGLVAALAYGIAANYTKRQLHGVDPYVTAAGSQVTASVLLLPLAALWWPDASPSPLAWYSVGALGVACTAVAYILYFRLIASVGPARAIAVTYLIPLFGMAWGLVFLHEAITGNMIAGCSVILAGTALATGIVRLPAGQRLRRRSTPDPATRSPDENRRPR